MTFASRGPVIDTPDNALARLIGSVVEIKWTRERKAFAGALVSSFFRDDDTGRYVVKFNQEMATLYGQGHTYIDWEQRQALGQNNLAKWLHGFYTTHAAPFGYKVGTLQKLCGSGANLREFRRLLKAALAKAGRPDIMIVVGGVIPPQDYDFLRDAGVQGIYGPGSNVVECAADVLRLLGHNMPPLQEAAE